MSNLPQKRIQKEYESLLKDPSPNFVAAPLKDDIFYWHFTIRGPDDTDFEGGLYHGVIKLPPTYPYKPPSVQFLNRSGRFEINMDICLSMTNYHKEEWQAAWTIRTMLEAIISFLPVNEEHLGVGALNYPSDIRKELAAASVNYSCPDCGPISKLLPKINKEKKPNEPSPKPPKPEAKSPDDTLSNQILEKYELNNAPTQKEENKIPEQSFSNIGAEILKGRFSQFQSQEKKEIKEEKPHQEIPPKENVKIPKNKNKFEVSNAFLDEIEFYQFQKTVKFYQDMTKEEIEAELSQNAPASSFDNIQKEIFIERATEMNDAENISEVFEQKKKEKNPFQMNYQELEKRNIKLKTKKRLIEELLKKKIATIKYLTRDAYIQQKKERIKKFSVIISVIASIGLILSYFVEMNMFMIDKN